MTKKAWIIFIAISLLLLGGLIYLSGQNKVKIDNVKTATIQQPTDASGQIGDNVSGNKDAKVILMEYGDFQCPGCGQVHPTIKAVTEKYQDKVAFVFRNFPIPSLHPNARAAAASAEAAGLQGKYWPMHNKIYENQSAWENASTDDRLNIFASFAQELGLDVTKFKTDFAASRVEQKIKFDQALAREDNVKSTPHFILNGQVLDQDTYGDADKLSSAIDKALKEAN